MREGYLSNMREHWRKVCQGSGKDPYQHFLDTFGDKAEYKHIALDSDVLSGKRRYGTQPYAVFQYEDNRLAFTITDLEALAQHARTHKLSGVRHHMAAQLVLATRDYQANEAVIADLSPHRNRPRTVFAR